MWLYNYAYNYNSAGMTESQKPGYNKYTSGIHLKYMSGIYTWNILQINFKYTSPYWIKEEVCFNSMLF